MEDSKLSCHDFSAEALEKNQMLEFERNGERFVFLKVRKTVDSHYLKTLITQTAATLDTICMEFQNLFFGKNKKTITNLSSAELAYRELAQVMVK